MSDFKPDASDLKSAAPASADDAFRRSEPVSMSGRIGRYLSLVRFSHTVFALPFAVMAFVLAVRTPLPAAPVASMATRVAGYADFGWREIVGVLLAMVSARTAAMAFNRWADRRIDADNPRTRSRHLPAGLVSVAEVWGLIAASSVVFVASTLLFLPNRIPLLASLPVGLFLLGYSLAKRFTSMAHIWLGVALALSPVCVWVAIRGEAAAMTMSDYAVPMVIAALVTTWVAGFDILYACQDAQFDRDRGLRSIPARFGQRGAMRIAGGLHLATSAAMLALGWVSTPLGYPYFAAVAIAIGLIVYQHRLVRPGELDRINRAFFEVNAIIGVLLMVAVIIDATWL